jgi:hypothetical protein
MLTKPVVLAAGEAKPCPWCGAQPSIQPWHGGRPTKKMICCDNPDCAVSPLVAGETRREALVRWNTRKRVSA